MIYFIRPTLDTPLVIHESVTATGRPIKIGSSINPIGRLNTYRKFYRRPDLQILGVMSGGMLAERRIHEKFDALRCTFTYRHNNGRNHRIRTEWFRVDDALFEFICSNTTVHFDSPPELAPLLVSERFLMWAERIAMRKGTTVEELLWDAVRKHVERDCNAAYPFTNTGKPSRF